MIIHSLLVLRPMVNGEEWNGDSAVISMLSYKFTLLRGEIFFFFKEDWGRAVTILELNSSLIFITKMPLPLKALFYSDIPFFFNS